MLRHLALLSLALTTSSCERSVDSQRQAASPSNLATLTAVLAQFRLDDPGRDAKENAERGDLRYIAICGFTCTTPGSLGADPPHHEVCNLEGTADVIEGPEHERLMNSAEEYARAYNEAMAQIPAGARAPNKALERTGNDKLPSRLRGACAPLN
jgi:hypothetical protein